MSGLPLTLLSSSRSFLAFSSRYLCRTALASLSAFNPRRAASAAAAALIARGQEPAPKWRSPSERSSLVTKKERSFAIGVSRLSGKEHTRRLQSKHVSFPCNAIHEFKSFTGTLERLAPARWAVVFIMQKFFADKQPAAKPTIVRLVEVTKMANSRVGVSFVMRGRSVIVHQVASTSPFEGKVFPGDLISLASDGIRALDANGLSQHIFAASSLTLCVETPALLASARSVFLLFSAPDDLGIHVDKCPTTGRGRVAHIVPLSAAATNLSRSDLAVGDLIVGVSEGGNLFDVADAKEVVARLKACESGAVEIRVVRASEVASAAPRSSRPFSARPRTAEPTMMSVNSRPQA